MKLAIHNGNGWNKRWIEYCKENSIEVLIVNCYDNDIIYQLKNKNITHLMWHFDHALPKDILMARNVLFSASNMGIKTFPDFNTCWHFDDKLSQKYLLESIDAPLVPSYAFFERNDAILWLENNAKFPIVAKLRRGAGSYNVKLLKNIVEAKNYVDKLFGSGVNPTPGFLADTKTKLKVAGNINGILKRLKKAPNYFRMVIKGKKGFPKEKGYVYFQDFIPNNKFDTRIVVIDNIVFGEKRYIRENDFRASGSGVYDYNCIDINSVKLALNIKNKLKVQTIAFDFVHDRLGNPLIVEISYGFGTKGLSKSPGYWTENLEFIQGKFKLENIILENFITNELFSENI